MAECEKSSMSTLVLGYGSIGMRHARILSDMGQQTAVVSSRMVDFPNVYSSLVEAIEEGKPKYVVIANSTHAHHESLVALAELQYSGVLLVEKPLFDIFRSLPEHSFRDVYVAYNLRFHPIIQRLMELLENETVLSVQAYVGQHLPDWRPGVDYRKSYSASARQGGGALRDLSHELDYLLWMLNGWERVAALGGHFSPLEIDSDDVFAMMLVTPRCPVVSIQMNYLDRVGRRSIIFNTSRHTIRADFIQGTITIDRNTETHTAERDFTYRAMHEAILCGNTGNLCTMSEGLETMRLIKAVEEASRTQLWVNR